MKKALFTLLLFCFGLFVSACGGGGGDNPFASGCPWGGQYLGLIPD